MGLIATLRRDEGGVAAVEFAFVMPVLLALLFGGFELTRIARATMRLNDASQTIADLVAQQTSVAAAGMSNFCTGAGIVMTPFAAGSFGATAASVTRTVAVPTVDWQDTTCKGLPFPGATTLADPYVPGTGDSIIVVQATYQYTPVVASVLGSGATVTLTRIAYARPRSGKPVRHS